MVGLRFVFLALFLTSCTLTPEIYPVREPFEYVIVGKTSIKDQDFIDFAVNKCKSPINITRVEQTQDTTIMYFTCKVGK